MKSLFLVVLKHYFIAPFATPIRATTPIELFNPPKQRLPSYSTIRRVLLKLDYKQYSSALARFFDIKPLPGETLAMDGKQLRGFVSDRNQQPRVAAASGYSTGECLHC